MFFGSWVDKNGAMIVPSALAQNMAVNRSLIADVVQALCVLSVIHFASFAAQSEPNFAGIPYLGWFVQ